MLRVADGTPVTVGQAKHLADGLFCMFPFFMERVEKERAGGGGVFQVADP